MLQKAARNLHTPIFAPRGAMRHEKQHERLFRPAYEVLQMNMKRNPIFKRNAMAIALAIVLGGGQIAALPDAAATPQPLREIDTTSQQGPASFSAIVQRVQPAVVNISTTGTSDTMPSNHGHGFKMPEFSEGSPFGGYFEKFFKNNPGQFQDGDNKKEFRAAGSGFIISDDGYVVTNNHVVKHADKIEVVMQNGNRYQARVKGRDAKTDLALLKITPDKALPYVELGDSDDTKVGDWVVAVGNPFGLGGTVTAGIISARGRDIQSGPFDDYLQIDAPINRGNSGGPLFDTRGQVIGINTAIYSPGGGNVGIGFAIPANMARDIVTQLQTAGSVERGWLGVQIQSLTAEIAESLGLKNKRGALVASVVPDSPAARSGIQPGDVIISMNGETLNEMRDLPKLVAKITAGSKAAIEIKRQGRTHSLDIVIGHLPNDEGSIALAKPDKAPESAKLGIYLAELTPEARKRYDVSRESNGVLVTSVEGGSPAAKAGIRAGNLINMVGQEQVKTPDQVVDKVREAVLAKRSSVLLLLEQEGEKRFIAVKFATA